MGSDKYDPKKPTICLPYLDANNLYGWAMSKLLPVSDFEWMNEKELEGWKKFPCILEVDLEYPIEVHDLHNDYPLATEKIMVGNVKKLLSTLNNKKKYIIHHESLKQCETCIKNNKNS